MNDRAHANILIVISLIAILLVIGINLYFAIECRMIVGIIRNLEKTLSTMSVEKAKIINFEYNKNGGTYIEFQINDAEIINKKTFALKYNNIKKNDEIHIIFNKKIFGDYIIIEGIESYEYEKDHFSIMFLVFLILLSYPLYRLIKIFIENNT